MDTTLQNRFNETRTMMEIKESSQHNQFVTTVGIADVLFLKFTTSGYGNNPFKTGLNIIYALIFK